MLVFDLISAQEEMRCVAQPNRGTQTKSTSGLARTLDSIASRAQSNLPYQLLHSGQSSSGEDFISSTDAVPQSDLVRKMIYPSKLMSNSFLAWDLELVLKSGIQAGAFWETVISTEEAKEYAERFVNKFMSEEGGEWHDDGGLSNAIKDSEEGQKLIADITKAFQSHMFVHKGDFTQFTLDNDGIRRPSFRWSSSPTLKILVGGTQEMTVTLAGIFYNVSNCRWAANIQVEIKDDFGVSESDITNPSLAAMPGVPGMMDMWILQRQRGQKPFTSVFNFNFWCSGAY